MNLLFSVANSPDSDSQRIVQLKMTTTDMSTEDKEFLASCEEEFKDRYTVNDKEFMKVFKSEPSTSPIIETWWVPQNSGRRNDRRHNRRNHPFERNNRDYDRGDRRGYNDDNRDRGSRGDEGGYHNHKPRYY